MTDVVTLVLLHVITLGHRHWLALLSLGINTHLAQSQLERGLSLSSLTSLGIFWHSCLASCLGTLTQVVRGSV